MLRQAHVQRVYLLDGNIGSFTDIGIFEVQLFPYGNTRETKTADGDYQYECQHGPPECTGNVIEACVIDIANHNHEEYIPILYCIEVNLWMFEHFNGTDLTIDDVVKVASNCWEMLMPDIPYSRIENCAKVNYTLLQPYFRIKN